MQDWEDSLPETHLETDSLSFVEKEHVSQLYLPTDEGPLCKRHSKE